MQTIKSIVFVTGNLNKVKEVSEILKESKICIDHRKLDLVEIQGSIEDVATEKAKHAAQIFQCTALVEDTGLIFKAWDNALPGPYIKDFVKALGTEKIPRLLDAFEEKTATAICIFALCIWPSMNIRLFKGSIDGQIIDAKGESGFGWDPIFQPKNYNQSFAEMDFSLKNTISHRRKAIEELKSYFINTN